MIEEQPSFDGLNEAIAALPGEKVATEEILNRIKSAGFQRMGEKGTICCLTLDNGYEVFGESACVDPANYRQEIGEKLAYQQAFNKLWPLFGFLLAESRYHRIAQHGPASET